MFTRFYSSIINNSTIITKLYQIWRLLNTHERGAGDWSRVSKGFHEVSCCHPIFRISLPNTVHRQYLVYDITEFMILVSSFFLQMLSFISFFYSFCSFLYGIPDIFQTQDKIHDVRSFSATLVPFFFFYYFLFCSPSVISRRSSSLQQPSRVPMNRKANQDRWNRKKNDGF